MTPRHPQPTAVRPLSRISRLVGRLRRLRTARPETLGPQERRNQRDSQGGSRKHDAGDRAGPDGCGPQTEPPTGDAGGSGTRERSAADGPPDGDPAGRLAGGRALDRLRAARLWVAANRPYYAEALFSCPVAVTDEVDVFAISADWQIYANPRFAETLPTEQLAALFVHEINHALRGHIDRGKRYGVPSQNKEVWNIAADCEINDDLAEDGLAVNPELLFPADFGLEPGQLAEDYYQQIIENAIPIRLHAGCCESATGGPLHPYHSTAGQGLDPARREQLRRRTARAVADHQREQGSASVPAGLARWADRHQAPAADWRRILAAELRKGLHRRHGNGDWTWARPPRRPDPSGDTVIRPGTTRPTADVAVVVDTSGSMQAADHEQAAAEIHAILTRAVPGEAINVYSVDTAARTAQTVRDARRIQLAGGGGTDMAAGIHTAAQNRPRPAVIIVITDGHTPWPPTRPPNLTATVIAVLTQPSTAQNVPHWITAIEASAPGR